MPSTWPHEFPAEPRRRRIVGDRTAHDAEGVSGAGRALPGSDSGACRPLGEARTGQGSAHTDLGSAHTDQRDAATVRSGRGRRAVPVVSVALAGALVALALGGALVHVGTGTGAGISGAVRAAATAGTTPTSPATLPAAPKGFAGQVSALYDDLYRADQLLQQGAGAGSAPVSKLPGEGTFAGDVAALPSQALDELYQAAEKNPQWATLPGRVQQLLDQIQQGNVPGSVSGSVRIAGQPTPLSSLARSVAHVTTVGSFPPAEPAGSFPSPPSPFVPSSPVGAYTPTVCPPGAPGGPSVAPGDSAIFAAQLTGDVAANVAQDVPDMILVVIAGEGTSIPDPAKYIAEAIQLAAVITLDTFNYVQAVANDCDTANRDGFLANIDNTTVNVYNLLTLTEQTLANLENSVNAVNNQVGVLQQTADEQLVLGIEQALTAPLGSPPNVAYELPASLGGNLDSTPVGVQEVVTNDLAAARTAGLPVNAAAAEFLAMGGQALAAGDDQQAYADFQNAYQQAAR